MRFASNTSRVVWALLVGGAFLSITLMQLTSAAAKPPDGKGGGKGGGGSAPPAVTDLAVIVDPASHNTITLVWHAPGDSSFTAVAYDIRYLIGELITDANWDAAWVTYSERDLEPVPQPGGSLETVTIQHLAGDQDYYFAMRVIGSKGNVSALSNNGENGEPVFAMTASAPVGAWDLELLAQGRFVGHEDFAFDPDPMDGQPSVVYGDWVSDAIWFAHYNGAFWETEEVRPNAGFASVLLEYDAMDRPTIVFSGTGIEGIWYGVRALGGGWSLQQITSSTVNGGVLDLTHDASGNPHVLFDLLVTSGKGKNRTRSTQLTFAIRDGSGWQLKPLDMSDSFLTASMTLDASDNAVVAYSLGLENPGESAIWLVRRSDSGIWTPKELVQHFPAATPAINSMAIDPGTGWPIIAIMARMDYSTQDWTLHVARIVGAAWQIELVDPFALNINEPHLRFDPTGAAVIAYLNYDSDGFISSVLLARDNGGTWDIETVAEDDLFAVGMSVANLRFDIDGNEVILFSIEHGGGSGPIDELFLTGRVP